MQRLLVSADRRRGAARSSLLTGLQAVVTGPLGIGPLDRGLYFLPLPASGLSCRSKVPIVQLIAIGTTKVNRG